MKQWMLPVCAAVLAAGIFCSCAPLQVANKVLDDSDLKDAAQVVGKELANEAPSTQTLLTDDLVRQNYTTDQAITQIEIEEMDAVLEIQSGSTQEIQVSYIEPKDRSLYTFEVRGSTLKIKKTGRVDWKDKSTPTTVITLPAKEYQSIEIEGDNLCLAVSGVDVSELDAEAYNGVFKVNDLQAKDVSFTADNGVTELTNLIAQKLDLEMDNGTLDLDKTRVDHYECEMDNGEISGTITGREDEYNVRVSIDNEVQRYGSTSADKTIDFKLDQGHVKLNFRL